MVSQCSRVKGPQGGGVPLSLFCASPPPLGSAAGLELLFPHPKRKKPEMK